jgi:hypothetical protein
MSVSFAAPITAWISAIATAALGVLGFFVTIWQWRRAGFSPQLTSRIDARGEAIELRIVNTGRAAGIIDQIYVVLSNSQIVDDAEYEGFRDNTFRSFALPAMSSVRIIVQAPEGGSFAKGAALLVGVGGSEPRRVTPTAAPGGVGLYGLASVLPPGTVN